MTREEIVNEYLKEHRHDVLLNPYAGLLDFAKYLDEHSELPEDLEEAAERYAQFYDQDLSDENGNFVNGCGDLRVAFIAGAEWQRKQDQNLIELAEDHAMLAGMNKMKQEMMEKAVEGRVIKSYNPVAAIGQPTLHGIELIYPDKGKPYLVAGETVKVIFIPEKSEKVK